jgi:hypothetical protein
MPLRSSSDLQGNSVNDHNEKNIRVLAYRPSSSKVFALKSGELGSSC